MTMTITISGQGEHYRARIVRRLTDGTMLDERIVGSGRSRMLDLGIDQVLSITTEYDAPAAGKVAAASSPLATASSPAPQPDQGHPAPLDLDTPFDPPAQAEAGG